MVGALCCERQSWACSLAIPSLGCKNGPWAWNTYLARNRVLTACAPVFCLSIIWHLASPTVVSVPWGEKEESLCCSHEGWVQAGCPAWLPRFPPAGHGGTNPQYWYWSCSVSSVWVKCCSLHCLTVLFSMVTPVPRCSEQKCLDFLHLVTGHRCHLRDTL